MKQKSVSTSLMLNLELISFRLDCNRFGGGVLIYVRKDTPCKKLTKHYLPDDIERIFVKINLRKIKWLLFRICTSLVNGRIFSEAFKLCPRCLHTGLR